MDIQLSQRGGTFLGFIMGLILGLAIAVAVALFFSHAPVPFLDKTSSSRPAPATGRVGTVLPDPNVSLRTRDAPKPEPVKPAPTGEQATAPAPNTATEGKFSLYDLLPGRPPQTSTPAKEPTGGVVKEAPADNAGKTIYFLQVGAYENDAEADTMSAKLALMGFEAKTSKFDRDGKTLRRVRIGPLHQQEDVERIRTALSNNKIEASVIRVPVEEKTKSGTVKKTSP